MNTKQNVGKLGAVKWPVLLTAGALAVAPLLNPVAVQAAPFRANNANITIGGVVTSDLAGNQFNMRGDDGRTYRVVSNRKEPGWLTNGDRVEVRGRLTNSRQNLIVASSVTHPGEVDGVGGASTRANHNVTVSGVVASDLKGNEFNMRANDGHIYRVVTTRTEPGWLSNGDRVTVQGRINNAHENRIIASNVTNTAGSYGSGSNSGGFGQTVTVSGVVTRDPAGNQFTLRSDDGRTYRVITNNQEPGWLTNCDHVTVRGQVDKRDRTLIIASNVTHPNGVGGMGAGLTITASGVVTRDPEGNQFTFRADDGRTYRVITNNQEPGWVTTGDRVTVRGKRSGAGSDLIIATAVTHQGGASSKGGSLSVNLSGVVTRDPVGNQFTFRSDDGRTYRVITNNQEPGWLTNGDRVTVRGKRDSRSSDLIIATSVTHPNGVNGNGAGLGVAMQGVVSRDRAGNQFTFRSDDGRTYRVITTNREPGWLTTGDRVVVRGRQDARDRDLIIATSVDHPNGTVAGAGAAYGRNGSTNSAVNFLGSVVSISSKGLIRNLSVRGDNGVVYAVTYRNLQTFRVGDRVQVIGTFSNGRVNASSVSAR